MSDTNSTKEKQKCVKVSRKPGGESVLRPTFAATRYSPDEPSRTGGLPGGNDLLQRQYTLAGGQGEAWCGGNQGTGILPRTAIPPKNQTIQRELSPEATESKSDSTFTSSTGSGHEFSHIPTHTQAETEPIEEDKTTDQSPTHPLLEDTSRLAGSQSFHQSRFKLDPHGHNGHKHHQTVQMQGGTGSSTQSCTLSSSMFTVSGATPQSSGNVTARRASTAGTMTLTGPLIRYDADVQLNSSFCPGSSETVEVGPTQTVNSGSRIGIYREAGLATGDVVARKHQSVQNVRDAQWTTDSRGNIVASFPEPWYGRPSRLSSASSQATVRFRDQPAAEFPLRIGNGFITETQGTDSFTVGLSAKKGSQLLHLSAHDWSVPWTMNLIGNNQGLPISISPASSGPSVTTGPIAMNASHEWIFFPTVADAEAVSVRTLIENLIPNDRYDTSRISYLNIIQALRNKAPKFQFTVAVNETADFWGDDELGVSVTGRLTARRGPFSLGDGDSQSFEVSLQEVFHDPILIHGSSSLLIIARDQGQGHAFGTIEWAYPFYDQTSPADFAGEEGEYTLTGTLV